jgi:hypothetical protein
VSSEKTVVGQPARARSAKTVYVSVEHRCTECGEMCPSGSDERDVSRRGKTLRVLKYAGAGLAITAFALLAAVGTITVTMMAMLTWA